MRGVGML